ncbi:2-oxo acid dehydrogenase subunit E2 [Alicyclobacillaceae bacterium I2511]|nr:2-oxo acid dehydrogenase subunit E2 [Alicyclobacillaceae bacterium I2511]
MAKLNTFLTEDRPLIDVPMPQTTDEPMESVIVFWYKVIGDTVTQHDVLAEVQTEKATFEVESPASGVLQEVWVQRGEAAPPGAVLARIATDVDGAGPASVVKTGESVPPATGLQTPQTERVALPPRLRRLAQELGVDVTTLRGSGTNRKITEEEIRRAAAVATEGTQSSISVTPVRRTIAKRMTQSLLEAPQLTEHAWADVTELERWRIRFQNIGWNAWVLRAVVLALQDHPMLNAVWEDTRIRLQTGVHLGVAVDAKEGLYVPVVRDAQLLNVDQLQQVVQTLANKVRSAKVCQEELTGGTFTVTNLGGYGVEFFTPILNPPQAAILGVGKMDERMVLVDGQGTVQKRLPLSLTFDHRVVDGGPAARFLQSIIWRLQEPQTLMR